MRKTLLTLTVFAGLAGFGPASEVQAAPAGIEGATVQTVQYYGGWRGHEWRRHERREHWHRVHEWREHRRWERRGW